jgi:hypothetical protein
VQKGVAELMCLTVLSLAQCSPVTNQGAGGGALNRVEAGYAAAVGV